MDRGLLAYAHIFKTAGTTLTGLLRRNFSIRHFDTRAIQDRPAITAAQLKRALYLYPRVESIAGHGVRTDSDLKAAFPQIRFYTFLRDPRARMISAFLFVASNRIRRKKWRLETAADIETAFEGFIDNSEATYCHILAPHGGGAPAAIETLETQIDFVGLVEHFDESLALFRNWIGRPDFDLRYRRMNVSDGRGDRDPRFARLRDEMTRLVAATKALTARPDIAARIAEARREDLEVFEHARTKIFERMRSAYRAGDGPFAFETDNIAADTTVNRLYRNFVVKPLVPLLARPTPAPPRHRTRQQRRAT